MITKGNIFSKPEFKLDEPELFEVLRQNDKILIERIITNGALKKPGEWYDQDKDEWVMLVRGEAEIEFQDGNISALQNGDYIFIPAHLKHRVVATSESLDCIWLAIHGDLS